MHHNFPKTEIGKLIKGWKKEKLQHINFYVSSDGAYSLYVGEPDHPLYYFYCKKHIKTMDLKPILKNNPDKVWKILEMELKELELNEDFE